MADYIVKDTELTSVANAIRTAGGTSSLLSFPNGFVSAVNNISGGGSSDFSTAEVTITKAEGRIVMWQFPTIISDKLVVSNHVQQELTETHPVALYKGVLEINIGPEVFSIISGNVTEDNGIFTITGDCSLQYIGF